MTEEHVVKKGGVRYLTDVRMTRQEIKMEKIRMLSLISTF